MITLQTTIWLLILTFSIVISKIDAIQYVYDSLNVPCSFWNTINITDGIRLANGSYLYDGRIYPEDYVGTYDYEFVNLTFRQSVKPHLRGCVCKMATCVRLCCPVTQYFDDRQKICSDPPRNVSTLVNVTDYKGNVETVNIGEKFGFVYGTPCEKMYYLDPASFEYDKWDLFENGTVFRWEDRAYLSKNDYCFSPTFTMNSSVMIFSPFVCFPNTETSQYLIYGIAMLTSVPFFIITVLVYLVIPELRNLHGKALCCYLSCLVVGYSCLGHTLIEGGIIVTDPLCEILGFTAYFALISSFLWLSVISFDLWWNFRIMTTRGPKKELKRFIMYSLYSWGLGLCFTAAVILIQKSNIPEEWKPGIGGGQFCWIDARGWYQLPYFYGPMIIIITFNIAMFVMTTYKIHHVKKETSKVMGREDSRRNINREKDNVGLFLRLFIVMGVTWSLDVVSWLLGKRYDFLFYITDICNAIQGLIIFILFVMKNKVKRLIIKKFNGFSVTSWTSRVEQSSPPTRIMPVVKNNCIKVCQDKF
ncbi:unnamed protein product [Hermetia illucens]|uniref:G-protein coupled receptors family 2 profile 2 domain-containing protein n=1 Tax=Hermetia illucens TaxID=343691 RepID=A0A7R8YUU3_HERIL|nr:G-protein coupled receptor Mth2-like isoform X2 [Hermetia illucens]CAD7083129.1 unnamed protein product [Hermetia illucens]